MENCIPILDSSFVVTHRSLIFVSIQCLVSSSQCSVVVSYDITQYFSLRFSSIQMLQNSSGSHPEPCDSQQCPEKLQFLLRKTTLCDKDKLGTCRFGKDCRYAHGRKELKPMPKWEICERNLLGRCIHSNNPSKVCVSSKMSVVI